MVDLFSPPVKKALVIFSSLVSCWTTMAQDTEAYGAGARALGGSGISLTDAWSALNNPASLAGFEGLTAGISYRNRFLVSEMADKSAAVCFNIGDSHFGIGFTSFGYSLFSRSRMSLSFARPLAKGFFAGAGVNYHLLRLGENYGSRRVLTAQLGAIYQITKKVSLAAQVFNPTNSRINDYADERMESMLRLGMRCDFSKRVFAVAEVAKALNGKLFIAGGLSYSPHEKLMLRIGANNQSFSFGVGAVFGQFLFDLSASYRSIPGFTPELSLLYNAPQ